jgi:DNA-binding response OmpR family regulator
MTKPFNNKELVLRVKKIVNRAAGNRTLVSELVIGDIKIDFVAKEAFLSGQSAGLTPIEYKLLSHMALNEGSTISWQGLLKEVWGHDDWSGGDKLVKVNIGRLRKKIEERLGANKYLVTVRGMGYKLVNFSSH